MSLICICFAFSDVVRMHEKAMKNYLLKANLNAIFILDLLGEKGLITKFLGQSV
jgi:hypothetical protein